MENLSSRNYLFIRTIITFIQSLYNDNELIIYRSLSSSPEPENNNDGFDSQWKIGQNI